MSFIKDETFGSALRLIAFGVDFGSANRRRDFPAGIGSCERERVDLNPLAGARSHKWKRPRVTHSLALAATIGKRRRCDSTRSRSPATPSSR